MGNDTTSATFLYYANDMKNTNWLSERVISLPMHTELSTDQQDFIVQNIFNFVNK